MSSKERAFAQFRCISVSYMLVFLFEAAWKVHQEMLSVTLYWLHVHGMFLLDELIFEDGQYC